MNVLGPNFTFLATLVVSVSCLAVCSGSNSPSSNGPSEEQVANDWQQYLQSSWSSKTCRESVEFTGVKVIGRSTEGNKAVILVEVSGNWKSSRNSSWDMGPCSGFYRKNGSGQKVTNRARYLKFDTGWRILSPEDLSFSRVR